MHFREYPLLENVWPLTQFLGMSKQRLYSAGRVGGNVGGDSIESAAMPYTVNHGLSRCLRQRSDSGNAAAPVGLVSNSM